MRLGKVEKEILATLLTETKKGEDFYFRGLNRKVAGKLGGIYGKGKWIDPRISASLSRAYKTLKQKELLDNEGFNNRCWKLTDRGRVIAKGIKISKAKINS